METELLSFLTFSLKHHSNYISMKTTQQIST